MIIKKNVTLYICEHCRKAYQSDRYIERHEKYCKKNPANDHKCFQMCKHLKRSRDYDEHEYGGVEYTVFICEKTGEEMYSYIAEKKRLVEKGYINGDRMPLECKHYDAIWML